MQKNLSQQTYQTNLEKHRADLVRLQQIRSGLGWLRLLVFVITIITAYFTFVHYGFAGLLPTVTGIAMLLFLVSKDVANNAKIKNTKTLIQINEEELQALLDKYSGREDGLSFAPANHAYVADLDIFGPSSIYQWLSRCYTEQGRQALAQNLLQPVDIPHVLARQEAVKEMAPNLTWRQQWQAHAMQATVTNNTQKRISAWAATEEQHFVNPIWKTFLFIYTVVAVGSAIAGMVELIPVQAFSALFFLYLLTSAILSRNTVKPYMLLDGIVKEIDTLQYLISWLETATVQAPHLQHLQGSIKGTTSAGEEIRMLKNILDRFDQRKSLFGGFFLNPFLLWNVRQMLALNSWRIRNKKVLPKWFEAVAEMEVLHSIATLHYNSPQFCFPQFSPQHFTIKGKAIGHPLLPQTQLVNNDFILEGMGKISLITGSNMAGKSTFLRSLGVNIVLAQMGAPVCAESFLLSPVQLVSSMRIADNLADNTSTFYAELKKLRTIIEAVKAHQTIFILLDEILRGTNSFDRHKGSAALIKQLIKENAVTVLATHDVELAELQQVYPTAIHNYHFDVEVAGEELYFDYKLKTGVCKSLNASILMKKIGIEMLE